MQATLRVKFQTELDDLRKQQATAPTGTKGRFNKRIGELEWAIQRDDELETQLNSAQISLNFSH